MPSITIRAQFSETETVDKLFQICRDLFPGEHLIQADQTHYYLELDLERSDYLMDQLGMLPDVMGFEPFNGWREHQRDQQTLQFGRQLSDEQFDAMVA